MTPEIRVVLTLLAEKVTLGKPMEGFRKYFSMYVAANMENRLDIVPLFRDRRDPIEALEKKYSQCWRHRIQLTPQSQPKINTLRSKKTTRTYETKRSISLVKVNGWLRIKSTEIWSSCGDSVRRYCSRLLGHCTITINMKMAHNGYYYVLRRKTGILLGNKTNITRCIKYYKHSLTSDRNHKCRILNTSRNVVLLLTNLRVLEANPWCGANI